MKQREVVYNKCGGRCAYCGQEITMKSMQVDHYYPKCSPEYAIACGVDVNHIDNLMPSCRQCNHYKRADSPKGWRVTMQGLHERVAKIYIHRVAVNFGMATLKPWDGKFYFETLNKFCPHFWGVQTMTERTCTWCGITEPQVVDKNTAMNVKGYYEAIKNHTLHILSHKPWCNKDLDIIVHIKGIIGLIPEMIEREDYEGAQAVKDAIMDFVNSFSDEKITKEALLIIPELKKQK